MLKKIAGAIRLAAAISLGLCASAAAFAANAPDVSEAAPAVSLSAAPLIYGQKYNLQNGYAGWTGGFLDTRGGDNCQDNLVCISTSELRNRDNSSGTWTIQSSDGIANGQPVRAGERVTLRNQYPFPNEVFAFLDTRLPACFDNLLCVSGAANSNRDALSGSWTILPSSGVGGTIYETQAVVLLNAYLGGGGYLDTRGSGCQSNLLCVSTATSRNRDSGSGWWRLIAPGAALP